MRTLSRLAAAASIVLLALSASAGAAHAVRAGEDAPDTLSKPSRHIVVLVGDPTVIPEGREVDEVIVGRGDAIIEGRVEGPVIVANGTAVIRGTVTDSVVVLRGRAIVEEGARVGGDVLSSRTPRVADAAAVDGDIQRVRFTAIFGALGTAARVFWWLAVSLSTLVAGLVFAGAFRGMATRTVDAGRTAVAPSIGAGFAATIGLPVISGLLLVTLVGIPLGLSGLFAMAPLLLVGYVAGALFLGSLIVQDRVGPLLAFCLGWLLLRLIGVVPFVGGLVTFAATVYGLGAVLVAMWRMTRPAPEHSSEVPAPPPAASAQPERVLVGAGGGAGDVASSAAPASSPDAGYGEHDGGGGGGSGGGASEPGGGGGFGAREHGGGAGGAGDSGDAGGDGRDAQDGEGPDDPGSGGGGGDGDSGDGDSGDGDSGDGDSGDGDSGGGDSGD